MTVDDAPHEAAPDEVAPDEVAPDEVVEETPRSWITGMVVAGAVLQLAGMAVVLIVRVVAGDAVDGGIGDAVLVTLYGLPAVFALLGLRRRWPLLLAAGIASLVLAVVPFSLHSFVFGPVGVAYLVACGLWRGPRPGPGRTAVVAAVVPALLLAAFVALLWHDDPMCYERHTDGTVVVHRDAESLTSGTQTIEPDSDVVESGCSSDSIVWWEAATSLALAAAALGTGLGLTGSRDRGPAPGGG